MIIGLGPLESAHQGEAAVARDAPVIRPVCPLPPDLSPLTNRRNARRPTEPPRRPGPAPSGHAQRGQLGDREQAAHGPRDDDVLTSSEDDNAHGRVGRGDVRVGLSRLVRLPVEADAEELET